MATVEQRLRSADVEQLDSIGETGELGEHAPLVRGEQRKTGAAYAVRSPFDDATVAVVHRAGPDLVEEAIASADAAFDQTRHLPTWKRSEILAAVADAIAAGRERLARGIALEGGKPIAHARLEADRAAFAFRIAAEEAKRVYGEIVPLDWIPGNEGRVAHVRRVPLGPVAGITPFNFPLMLVAHKVAPALAAGDPIVLRPASQTPVSSFELARIVLEAGWPEDGDRGRPLVDRGRTAPRRGRARQAADVHGEPGCRLGAEGPCRSQARSPRARRQRAGRRRS